MWWIVLAVVAVIAAALVAGMLIDGRGRKEAASLSFTTVNFNDLHDGVYQGEYQGTKSHLRDTAVEIEIHQGSVSNIKIVKGAIGKDGQPVKLTGNRTIEDLFKNALDSRTLDVDVISGATITSKTHLKALEQALLKAQ